MSTLIEHVENRNTLYLVPVPGNFGENSAFMDVTETITDSKNRDQFACYSNGNGPRTGQEVERARLYAEYVGQYATVEDIHRYNTDKYTFFVTPAGQAIEVREKKVRGDRREKRDHSKPTRNRKKNARSNVH